MSSDIDRVINNFQRLARDLESKTPHAIATATARSYTSYIRDEIRSVAPSGKLTGVGSKARRKAGGARVGVKYDVKNATAIVQATGPLHLVERNTSKHSIPRTAGSRRLRTKAGRLSHKREATGRSSSGRKFLGNKSRGFAAMGPVNHPGTKGKHPFERGVKRAERAAMAEAVREFTKEMSSIYQAAT